LDSDHAKPFPVKLIDQPNSSPKKKQNGEKRIIFQSQVNRKIRGGQAYGDECMKLTRTVPAI